ncbi:MAG TPA: PilZ domain-containing protein, partial [Polyangiaceae bacterium]|nr:PilZ domain-containing protein [Polyangiaceae bacterium]
MSDPNEHAERRVEERFATYVAVEIVGDGKRDRFGVSRDASTGGMKIATPSHFEVGAELTLRLHAPGAPPAELRATVLR